MEYYLSTFEGNGSRANPFKPKGNIPGWTMIDLRPRGDRREGYCLLATPEKICHGLHLGNNISERLPETVKRKLQNSLGLTISRRYSKQLPKIVAELLTDHARADGSRWRSLMPERKSRRWKIYLGKQAIYNVPMVGGGVTITESWTGPDDPSNIDADQPWTFVIGGDAWALEGNKAVYRNTGGATYTGERCDTDVSTQNQYVQAQLITFTRASALIVADILARLTSSSTSHYRIRASDAAGVLSFELAKSIQGGSETALDTDAQDPTLNDTLRIECDGSSITGKVNTITIMGPSTDTEIAGAGCTRGGIAGYSDGNIVDEVAFDNWAMGDLPTSANLMGAICM